MTGSGQYSSSRDHLGHEELSHHPSCSFDGLVELTLPNSLQETGAQGSLVGLLFLVFLFIPASNIFFRVGFVVAERVLYTPSMGYCILFVHGLSKLCIWLNRCGATTLIVSTVLLLLLFSWKTVKQNEIWLSREYLFRSGVQMLPHNAKVPYNYAKFLKDQCRTRKPSTTTEQPSSKHLAGRALDVVL
ncbi:Transmembrane and TPR repeat-containing protein 1 [Sciurus carolinensis]|uniref:Transmembrane and TPR repeat-containing protein 1 n=1 Tax=Sciurus carolinensis TaxID=30640 RepID=A0AA41MKD8_SCICA|nr:Transmembrane and TPR repeat-containing protein 1 [Sciurus carolinensis]